MYIKYLLWFPLLITVIYGVQFIPTTKDRGVFLQKTDKLNRLDVDIITLNWLNDHWRNLSLFKHIVIDHRLELTPEQLDEIQYINFYLDNKPSKVQGILD